MSCRTISVQVATIVFTSRLKTEILSLGLNANDISNLLGDLGASTRVPAEAEAIVLHAYQVSIRDGLVVAIVFAAMSLVFAMALPWPRLKGGITDHRQVFELENNSISTAPHRSSDES